MQEWMRKARPGRWPGKRTGPACEARQQDRKSTRLNSSHRCISYAVFCLKTSRTSCTSTLSLHDALPISVPHRDVARAGQDFEVYGTRNGEGFLKGSLRRGSKCRSGCEKRDQGDGQESGPGRHAKRDSKIGRAHV